MSTTWPTPADPCYDCGSDLPGHHTPLCSFKDPDDTLDLKQIPGTQWWVNATQRRLNVAVNEIVGKMARGYLLEQRRHDQVYLLNTPDGMEFFAAPAVYVERLLAEKMIEEDVARSTDRTLYFRLVGR